MEVPERKHRHRRKKRSLEDSGKRSPFRKIESVVSKYLLRVIGVIFILASIWYAASSAEKILSIAKNLASKEIILPPATINPGQTIVPSTKPVLPVSQISCTTPMIIWVLVIAGLASGIFLLTRRLRRKETGRISILVFYPALILLAKNFGWQVHLLFPLILLFSILLYRDGIRLRTTIATKINTLMAWGFFGIWWILNVALGGQKEMLFPTLLYSTLFFCWFFWIGIRKGYSGYHKSSKYTEIIVVLVNTGAYYLFTCLTLYKFGFAGSLWLFTLVLSLLLFGAMYLSDKFTLQFNKIPSLYAGMILMSLVFPLLFRMEIFLLFFGCLSVLLLLYGRFSGEQSSIIGSLVSLVIMMLIFLQNWILQFLPAAFLRDILSNTALVNKGILAGLVAVPVLFADHALLKDMEITFSKKWFKRRTYLRLMKGAILLTTYLTGFWIFNYAVMLLIDNNTAKFLSWFCFSCLYFIVVLPILSKQKSSYFQPFIWLSLFILVIYPGLIHLTVVDMRNESLKHIGYSQAGFIFHYLGTTLLIINLWLTGIYFTRIYKEKRPYLHGFWTFILLMLIFLTLSEMDHLTIITGLKKGIRIEDLVLRNRQLPYTIVLIFFSAVILSLGFFRRNRFLRALALVILAITLIKFLYLDIRYIGSTGKTILLFTAGIVVIIISFFYSRIRTYFHYRDSGHHQRHSHHHHHRKGDETQSKQINNPDATL